MLVLGITGGVATGKSTVTRMLAEGGAPTISADAVAHDLLGPGTETNHVIRVLFRMSGTPDDPIDRQALRQIVFANPTARKQLEAITHPLIIATLTSQIDAWRAADHPLLGAAEIPLLFEAGLESLTDHIVVVACSKQTQLARLCERSHLPVKEARRIISAQWPLARKIARAHSVITTDAGLDDTRRQVAALRAKLV